MLKKYLFADLDDTLFQSRRKCPDDAHLTPVAYLKDGTAHSFSTESQCAFLAFLQREMAVVPVTARNHDAFKRVRLKFEHGAVVNYGGVILRADGTPDEAWLARSRWHARGTLAALDTVQNALRSFSDQERLAVSVRIVEDFSVPFYVCAKSEEGDETAIDHLESAVYSYCQEHFRDLSVHRNGNNLSILPNWLDKKHAVEHLVLRFRKAHGEVLTFGMGDSLSDLAFMSACDYALVPQASQITRRLGGR